MPMRLSGIGTSGLDTEAIIKVLVDAKKMPITSFEEKIDDEEDLLAAWNTVDTSLNELKDVARELNDYSTWRQMAAESSDSDTITATAENTSTSGAYNTVVTTLAAAHRVASSNLGTDPINGVSDITSDLQLNGGAAGSFQIGGATIETTGSESLTDIKDLINTASANMDDDNKVKATIIGTTLVLERDKTGVTEIQINDDTDGILQELGILNSATLDDFKDVKQTALDLVATINDIAITSSDNTGVDDAVSGVSFNFKATGSATINIKHDTETIKSLVEDFLEKYNKTMKEVKAYGSVGLGEEGNLESLGHLQGDRLISEIGSKSRLAMTGFDTTGVLDEAFNSMHKIGLWSKSEENELFLVDEAKFDDALENNFDAVEDLFRSRDAGIMDGFEDLLDSFVDPIDGRVSSRKTGISAKIKDTQSEIDYLNLRLLDYETELWAHYAHMETSVSAINQQGSFMASAMGG